jgi:putative FmdB family regulatory protein
MPLYQTRCQDCDRTDAIWRRVADRDKLTPCVKCHGSLIREISAPYIAPDIQPYVSPATGKVVNSRTQQQNDLKASGHILNEPGLKNDIARRREERKEETFKPIEAAVDASVNNLVNRGLIGS